MTRMLLITPALAALLALAACTSPAAAPATPASAPAPAAAPAPAPAAPPAPGRPLPPATGKDAPPQACLDVLDQLSRGIPTAETGPALRARGLRIRTPITVAPELSARISGISGARVRVMVDAAGKVVPGTVEVQQHHGDRQLAEALPAAVEQTLSFDTRAAANAPARFPFTTVYVACSR